MMLILKTIILTILLAFSSLSFSVEDNTGKNFKSFNEAIDYLNLGGVRTTSEHKFNMANPFKIPPERISAMKSIYGNDFYTVEFFLYPRYEIQLVQLNSSLRKAVKLSEIYSNIIVKVYVVEESAGLGVDYLHQIVYQKPKKYGVWALADIAPDYKGVDAYMRGLKTTPAIVVTKGTGKSNNVVLITDNFSKLFPSIIDRKILKKYSEN